jgi:hypothetical protein
MGQVLHADKTIEQDSSPAMAARVQGRRMPCRDWPCRIDSETDDVGSVALTGVAIGAPITAATGAMSCRKGDSVFDEARRRRRWAPASRSV